MDWLFRTIQWPAMPLYVQVLCGVILAAFLVQVLYYLIPFRGLARKRQPMPFNPTASRDMPMSIVVCAHNERENLERLLPMLLKQDYPEFEVLVVNNSSTDDTETFLSMLKLSEPRLQFSTIEPDARFYHDNKLAITMGVKGAAYNHILFTEADCMPPNNNWLRSMQAGFAEGHQLVLGYCRHVGAEQGDTKFRQCESLFSAMLWLYAARCGHPYRGTMKNIGFTRDLFLSNKGFANLNSVPLSEATLFLSKAGNKTNTTIQLAPDAIVSSTRQLDTDHWLLEQRRYASLLALGKHGRCTQATEMLSRVVYYLGSLALLVLAALHIVAPGLLLVVLPLWLIRLTVRGVVMRTAQRLLKEQGIFLYLLLYDCIQPLFTLFVVLTKPNLTKLKKVGA